MLSNVSCQVSEGTLLYGLYDMQHVALYPARLLAEATQNAFQNPFSPASYTRAGRTIAAGAELFERTTRRFGKPAFGLSITRINGDDVAVKEVPVLSKPFCNLVHFDRVTDEVHPTVLVIAPMSGHYATLLRGTVEALLPEHDVYITDWLDARTVPLSRGSFDLEDYITYVMAFLAHLGPQTHVIAVCQPTVPVLCAVSLMAQNKGPEDRSLGNSSHGSAHDRGRVGRHLGTRPNACGPPAVQKHSGGEAGGSPSERGWTLRHFQWTSLARADPSNGA
jgi:polyhydroxyalkanoate depolymerase